VFEGFDLALIALYERFDPAIIEILNVTVDLMPGRRTLGEVPEADALHKAAYKELSGNNHPFTTRDCRSIPARLAPPFRFEDLAVPSRR
jgi:hypothetical protein